MGTGGGDGKIAEEIVLQFKMCRGLFLLINQNGATRFDMAVPLVIVVDYRMAGQISVDMDELF